MDGSCQHKALFSCRNALEIADYVKRKIEVCIQKYMSFEETSNYLKGNHQISHNLTKIIWEELKEENPDFFSNYYLRCKTAIQIKQFNDLLAEQAALMIKYGCLDHFDASLTYNTETMHTQLKGPFTADKANLSPASLASSDANGVSVMQSQIPYDQQNQVHRHSTSLAVPDAYGPSADKANLSPASLASSDANGLSVMQSQIPYDQQNQVHRHSTSLAVQSCVAVTQSQIPYDQQNQVHRHSTSLAVPDAYGPPVSQFLIPNDQQNKLHEHTHNDFGAQNVTPTPTDLAYDCPGLPTYTPAATNQWSLYDDLYDSGAQTDAVVPTMPQDPCTIGVRGDIGHNGPRTQYTDFELAPQQFIQSNEQIHGLDGLYPPHYGGSNGFLNGGGNNVLQNGEESNELQNGGGSNGFQNGRGSNEFLDGEEINGFLDGEEINGFLDGEEINGFLDGEEINGFLNGEGSIGFLDGEGSIGFLDGGESNWFLDGGESNWFLNGGGSNGFQNGGGNNELQNGGQSNGLQNGGGSNSFQNEGGIDDGLQNGGGSLCPQNNTNQC